MITKNAILIIVAMLVVIVFVAFGESATTRQTMPKWEYAQYLLAPELLAVWKSKSQNAESLSGNSYEMFVKMGGRCHEDKYGIVDLLNLVGGRGWELVAIQGDDKASSYIFKRPK